MTIRARFTADIGEFREAVERAAQHLDAFQYRTDNVSRSLQQMVRQFDGTAIIRQAELAAAAVERIGGVSRLTAQEQQRLSATVQEALAKYRALGQEAPASLTHMAGQLQQASQQTSLWGAALGQIRTIAAGVLAGFTIDRVVRGLTEAVTHTIQWGASMTDLSAKTGVSMAALQRWDYAAQITGASLQSLITASLDLSRRIGEGAQETRVALERLGLSIEAVRRLSPQEQFDAIADALSGVKSQADRAAIAADLFGRGWRDVLPVIAQDFAALRLEAERLGVVVREETLQQMDALSDSWARLKLSGRALLAETLTPLLTTLNDFIVGSRALAETLSGRLLSAVSVLAGPLGQILTAVGTGRLEQSRAGQQLPSAPTAPALPTPGALTVPGVPQDLAEITTRLRTAQQEATRTIAQAGREHEELARAASRLAAHEARLADQMGWAAQLPGGRLQERPDWTRYGPGLMAVGPPPNPFDRLRQYPQATGWTAPRPQPVAWAPDWGQIGAMLPGVLVGAFQGGGSAGRSLGGFLGGALTQTIGRSVGTLVSRGIGGALGSAIGGALGSAIPVVGTVLGSLLGGLFGPSRGALLGKEADARIAQLRQDLLQRYGSLDQIRALGPYGQALAEAWGSRNVQGEQWMRQLVQGLERQLDLQQRIKAVETERAALAERLVPTYEQIVEVADRYGLSIDALGQQVRQLGATTTWRQMLEDLQLLERAGADMGAVLSGMADEISVLVQRSLAMGTTVPANLRPYIEELARAGLLLDAQGQAITDLTQIKWGDPIATEADKVREAIAKLDETFGRLQEQLDKLIDALGRGLPAAAELGAAGVQQAFSGVGEPDVRYGGPSPIIEGFQSGSGGLRDFGRGTLAVLHGREAVLTEAQWRTGRSASIAVTINVAGYLDSISARDELARQVAQALEERLRWRHRAA